ncbi:hypothetical protein [Agaribacterium sp. ZY112]|uniref:hypothetical protein n=1 Tax=Agaribacterium sp. ZY112 TaxID=3233574 RepID=UPI003525B958
MNLDKSKKRIAKKIKMGFQGYPELSINYVLDEQAVAKKVLVTLILEEGVEPLEESLNSDDDARENEVIQSAIVKMIERSDAKTVKQSECPNR